MFILANESNGYVYAYNEKCEKVLKEQGKLHQYTDRTVAIVRGSSIYIHNDQGNLIAAYPRDFVDTSNIIGVVL